MGARAFSHSGFFCGRRGARSIWTSSTELAIKVIRCESLLYDASAVSGWYGTEVTFNHARLVLNSGFCGRKLTQIDSMALRVPCASGAVGSPGRIGPACRGALLSFR